MFDLTHSLGRIVFPTVVALCAQGSLAQGDEPLCQVAMKPVVSTMTLQWDSFNMFGDRKEAYVESGYKQTGEGRSCRIAATRSGGTTVERPCTWNSRLVCDLKLGKGPVSHSFSAASYQYGKVEWVGNESMPVKVKRGSAVAEELRSVAVVKFNGNWSRAQDRGVSVATMYFDREWGLLIKVEGAHDQNRWGDTVTLVEFAQ